MKRIFTTLVFLVGLVGSTSFLSAQTAVTTQPRKSQKSITTQTLGITDITVTYHRPAVKERELWGKLVPYDAVWRAGANENTVIHFSHDVQIEGQDLAAGTYGLHILPTENKWTVIFSNNNNAWGSYTYNPKEDALRVDVHPAAAGKFYEYLTYDFENIQTTDVTCTLLWGDKKVPFVVSADVHGIVLENLRKELQLQAGWTWMGWNEAATYCLNNNINTDEALGWASRSAAMNSNSMNIMTYAKLSARKRAQGDTNKEKEMLLGVLEEKLNALSITWREWHSAAQFAMKEKNMEKAMAFEKRSISMNSNMNNLMGKADILVATGDEDAAEKLRKDALQKGTNAELNTYGYQLLNARKPAKAVEVFEANAKKHPEDPNVWDSLGEGYMWAGQQEKAIEALKKCLSMNPIPAVKTNSLKNLKRMGVDLTKTTP